MNLYAFKLKIFRMLPIRIKCLLGTMRSGGSLKLGRGSFVHKSVHLIGKKNIAIGNNTCVSEGGWLNVNHRQDNEPAIIIGSNCFIGKNNFFSSGERILVADYTLTAIDCKFMGSSHVIDNPLTPYMSSGTTNDWVIDVGVNCFFGAGAMVTGNIKIGHGSVIGAGSHVLNDVPPFSVVIGNPGKVIRRYSFVRKEWVAAEDVTESDVASMPPPEIYLQMLSEQFPVLDMPWIAAGRSLGNL